MHIAISKRPNNVDVDSITLDDEEEEESCAVQDSTEIIQLEHHIVYSTSFQVPVLYFRVSFSDGTPLSHQEIFQFVIPNDYHDANITQNEHPILGKPCWYIHPCNTRGLMETMAFDQLDYIKAWLSVYGPIAKYNIPNSMFQ
ncbi:hypothetical protein [Parasitella parasitica]|uniref:Ubiquitin-like-conjugating enzyme ATG10 n=1 Tax=Parasitella parasitica TaxID=35722 RepID=A0A0B7NKD4_9FUNG|nr:hypothetical protein [Parasitella parasitica]